MPSRESRIQSVVLAYNFGDVTQAVPYIIGFMKMSGSLTLITQVPKHVVPWLLAPWVILAPSILEYEMSNGMCPLVSRDSYVIRL